MPHGDATGHLPVELLHRVLDYLPKATILQFSHLSGRLRQIASTHPRCLIPVTLLYDIYTDDSPSNLSKALEIVSHAIAHGMQLSVIIGGSLFFGRGGARRKHVAAIHPEIFEFLVRMLPVCAWLDVYVPREHRADMYRALSAPAPVLRKLTIQASLYINNESSLVHVPSDIFSGHAPRLSRITLDYPSLGDIPIPAFHNIRRAALKFAAAGLQVAHHFPTLRHLELGGLDSAALDYRNLALEHLHINCPLDDILPVLDPQMKLSTIPVITYTDLSSSKATDDRVWSGLEDAALALTLGERNIRSWIMSLRSRDAPQRQRAFLLSHKYRLTFKLAAPLAPRIVDIRVTNTLVGILLGLQVALPALRHLQIDLLGGSRLVVWTIARFANHDTDAFDDEACVVSCPQLQVLELRAASSPVLISSDVLVRLGRSFGQLERKADQRAHLELRGVQFGSKENQGVVRKVFPRISVYDFDPVSDREMQDRLRF